MLKAWEKVNAGAGAIANFKAWVSQLTRNLCTDIWRSLGREAKRIEIIEALAFREDEVLVYQDE